MGQVGIPQDGEGNVIILWLFLIGLGLTTVLWGLAMLGILLMAVLKVIAGILRVGLWALEKKAEPPPLPPIMEEEDYDPVHTIEARRGRDFRRL